MKENPLAAVIQYSELLVDLADWFCTKVFLSGSLFYLFAFNISYHLPYTIRFHSGRKGFSI